MHQKFLLMRKGKNQKLHRLFKLILSILELLQPEHMQALI